VISTGDVFITTLYPVIRPEDGGGINGVIAALNAIIALTVPEEKQEGGTMVIPGHGRLADEADVVEYRDMVTIIRDRVAAMIEMGMSLRQVQAAKPTRDYDGRYGADSGFWTTEQFVEAVYRSLSAPPADASSAPITN
jgi:glyoxylase-like metal-dependent hydrolase (beta-lactamase superfamily II)